MQLFQSCHPQRPFLWSSFLLLQRYGRADPQAAALSWICRRTITAQSHNYTKVQVTNVYILHVYPTHTWFSRGHQTDPVPAQGAAERLPSLHTYWWFFVLPAELCLSHIHFHLPEPEREKRHNQRYQGVLKPALRDETTLNAHLPWECRG